VLTKIHVVDDANRDMTQG